MTNVTRMGSMVNVTQKWITMYYVRFWIVYEYSRAKHTEMKLISDLYVAYINYKHGLKRVQPKASLWM